MFAAITVTHQPVHVDLVSVLWGFMGYRWISMKSRQLAFLDWWVNPGFWGRSSRCFVEVEDLKLLCLLHDLAWGKDFEDFLKIQRRTLSNLPYQLCRACGLAILRHPQDVFVSQRCLSPSPLFPITVQGPDLLCWITMARWQSRQSRQSTWSEGALELWSFCWYLFFTTLIVTWYTDIPTWSWPDLSRNVPWPAAINLPMTHWPWHGRCLNFLCVCVRESPKFPSSSFLARCVPL